MSVSGNFKVLLIMACCGGISPLAPAAQVTPLESCPEVARLWMGMEEGVIRPAAYLQIRADADGYVVLHAENQQILRKGEHWATLDPEQLDIERRAFGVDQSKQKQLLEKGREDAQDARLRLSLELHETEGKRENLKGVLQEAAIPIALKRRASEALVKLNERITRFHEKLDPAIRDRDLHLLDEDNAVQIARKQKQLLNLEKRCCLLAEFAGQLRFSDGLKEKLKATERGKPIWMKGGDLLGTIVDDRHYEISVSAAGPLLSDIPSDQILVFIQDAQTGKMIAGEYSRTDELDNGKEISRNFIFVIREDGVEGARQAQGTRNLVHVYRKFSHPYRLVYKKDIAFSAPEILENSGWDGLVRHLWPGSKVIQVGPQTIAVEPKNAN